ncbi:MAG: phosphoribosylglycinamide formyltransferase [Opitutaceae bacterium]|nr:phosphoribosylglycinamide formyltransferase [Opitutaceae bacterium]
MRIVILGSGRGSNAEAILQVQQAGKLGRGRVVQIFSDRPDAGILALGPRFGLPADFLDPSPFKTKLDGEGEQHYIAAITACKPDLIVLAGFMRVLKLPFVSRFEGKIINLHPSLLPSFPGLDAIGQAFRRGVKITGCTVHYVTLDVDGGPIIDQEPVRIEDDDTVESLAEKVHAAEHALLPSVIARLSEKPL